MAIEDMREATSVQSSVRVQEAFYSAEELEDCKYTKYAVNQAIVHGREDIVSLVSLIDSLNSKIQRTNNLLMWISTWLFLIISIILWKTS